MKHRIVHTLQKYLLNPPIKLALAMGLPLPGYALLETTGRKTGKPRRDLRHHSSNDHDPSPKVFRIAQITVHKEVTISLSKTLFAVGVYGYEPKINRPICARKPPRRPGLCAPE